jgi:hypothetical protein
MHHGIKFPVIGDALLVAFTLHEMEGKGSDGARDEGDGVIDGRVIKSGRFGNILSRYRLRTSQVPQ